MSKALRRLSTALGAFKPPVAKPQAAGSDVARLLTSSKQAYLKDSFGNARDWTVVMGNEAGDLDSLSSSIALAWLLNEVQKKPAVALVQTDKEDLRLREENLYALSLAGITKPVEELLLINDFVNVHPFPSHDFALVDHNRLGSRFTLDNPQANVVTLLDHHDDEGLYKEFADPRVVLPAGSCASHVAVLLPTEVPKEIATLLLCAILIDTGGLKPGGKALEADYRAAAFLVPRSTLQDSALSAKLSSFTEGQTWSEGMFYEDASIRDLSDQLARKKEDVSKLNARDHLRRDYKEYSFTAPWLPSSPTLKAGLSTVPVSLDKWAGGVNVPDDTGAWMQERGLAILGVLTSFNDEKKFRKNGKGKHRREQLWVVRSDAPLAFDGEGSGTFDVNTLLTRLVEGLTADQELQLEPHKKFTAKALTVTDTLRVVAFKQGNAKATRKVTAPILKAIVEKQPE